MAWKAQPPGWRPGGERLVCVLGNGSHTKPQIAENQALGGLRFRLLTEALHERGPRPCAEVLAEALHRLDPDDRVAVLELAERIAAWPPAVIRYFGADRFARPPLALVR